MSMSAAAMVAARRHLAERVRRFLAALEKQHREPNRLEGDQLLTALGHLIGDQLPQAEQAMQRAEAAHTATPQQLANIRAGYGPVTAEHVRSQLGNIMRQKS